MNTLSLRSLVSGALFFLVACGQMENQLDAGSDVGGGMAGGGAAGGGMAGGGSAAQVKFATSVAPILASRCGQCHMPLRAADTAFTWVTGMSAPMSAMNPCGGQPRMVSGDAEMSLLYNKLQLTPRCGGRMPGRGAPQLPEMERFVIRDWINQGATNN